MEPNTARVQRAPAGTRASAPAVRPVSAPGAFFIGDSEVIAWWTDFDGTEWAWALDRATRKPRTLRRVMSGDYVEDPYLFDNGTWTS